MCVQWFVFHRWTESDYYIAQWKLLSGQSYYRLAGVALSNSTEREVRSSISTIVRRHTRSHTRARKKQSTIHHTPGKLTTTSSSNGSSTSLLCQSVGFYNQGANSWPTFFPGWVTPNCQLKKLTTPFGEGGTMLEQHPFQPQYPLIPYPRNEMNLDCADERLVAPVSAGWMSFWPSRPRTNSMDEQQLSLSISRVSLIMAYFHLIGIYLINKGLIWYLSISSFLASTAFFHKHLAWHQRRVWGVRC